MAAIVLDTSVLVKWFKTSGEALVLEAESVRALVDRRSVTVYVPTLALYEIGNVLSLKSEADADELSAALAALRDLPIVPIPPDLFLLTAAARLAREFGISFYDASFAALAVEVGCPFVTADDRLARRLGRLGVAIPLSRAASLEL